MYGMTINGIHSFKDLGLVPTTKPNVSLPAPKLSYVEIPGTQGSVDITESLAGEVLYEMREGSLEFLVAKPYLWEETCTKIKRSIHGVKATLILDTEPSFYYQGRVYVSDFKSDKNFSTITLTYKLEPYKYSVEDMATDGVYTLHDVQIKDKQAITLAHDFDMTLIPTFNNKTTNVLSVEFEGHQYSLNQGLSRFPEIRTRKNNMTLVFRGSSTLDISHKRGWL